MYIRRKRRQNAKGLKKYTILEFSTIRYLKNLSWLMFPFLIFYLSLKFWPNPPAFSLGGGGGELSGVGGSVRSTWRHEKSPFFMFFFKNIFFNFWSKQEGGPTMASFSCLSFFFYPKCTVQLNIGICINLRLFKKSKHNIINL